MKAKMISHIKEGKKRLTAQKIILKIFTIWSISLFLILGHFSIGSADDQIITTAVGRGIGDNGPALDAILRSPDKLALHNGEMFIWDRDNRRIRKVNLATGIITTFAGNGLQCFPAPCGDGGPATEARLSSVSGMAVDEEGNLYIAEGARIRKVDSSSGIITTYAGTGTTCSPSTNPCGDGGPAISANLTAIGIVVKNGNLYVVDQLSNRIRKIDLATTIITTVAGTGDACMTPGECGDGGLATEARLFFPFSVAVDDAENLYFVDQGGFTKIRKVDSSTGIITHYAGTGPFCSNFPPGQPCGDGDLAASARFNAISDLAVGDGSLYVADFGNNRVRKIDLETTIITRAVGTGIACSPTMGPCGDGSLAVNANLNEPRGIAHDGSHLYVSDTLNHRIRKIDSEIITTVAGMTGKGDGGQAIYARLDNPNSSVLDCGGRHFLTESASHRIREIDMATGIISTVTGNGISCFRAPCGDGGPAVDAQVSNPQSVTCNSTGTAIYFASGGTIRKIDLDTEIISRVAGNGFGCFSITPTDTCGDGGLATEARVTPAGLIERDGNLYISEAFTRRIRRVDSDGMISTVAGTGSAGSRGDGGPALAAIINGPGGLNFDSAGNLYIACVGFPSDHVVRMVTPGADELKLITGDSDEIIDRVAGTYDTPGFFGDGGLALLARLSGPNTPVIDPEGNLYFTQSGNHIVSRVDLSGIISTVAGIGTISGFFGDGGPATSALLRGPTGMAMDDAGNTYIDDAQNHRVRRLNEAAAYCDIDPDTINTASSGKWATMYYEPKVPHTSDQIVKTLIYAVDENGDRISDVLEPEPGSPMSTTADSNANGVFELMRKFNLTSVKALVDKPQTAYIIMEVLFDDGRYGACSHVIRVVEPPQHEPSAPMTSEPIEEETVF